MTGSIRYTEAGKKVFIFFKEKNIYIPVQRNRKTIPLETMFKTATILIISGLQKLLEATQFLNLKP